MDLTKGVPQGSILGSQLFNIVFNDIYFFVEVADLLNYADDNTLIKISNPYMKFLLNNQKAQ